MAATVAAGQSAVPEACLSAARPELCASIEAGELADLRWPVFRDYREHVRNFYKSRNFALAWSAAGQPTPQARAMTELLAHADVKGLRAEDYDGPRWQERLAHLAQAPSASGWEKFDLALTVSAMRYASDVHNGRVNPHHARFDLNGGFRDHDLAKLLLERVIAAPDVAAVFQQLEPPYLGYQRTLAALQHYQALARDGEDPALPAPKTSVKPGDSYPALDQLAKRLRRLGDLPTDATSAANGVYEGALLEAVKRFQRRHALIPDGSLGSETVKQLNVPLAARVEQLQLTLERWRWLPPDLPARLVVVNIPEFVLRLFENHRVVLSMKVIVGRAFRDRRTPVFQDEMEYVVFRPYWNVPAKITRQELAPEIAKNEGYMARHHYQVVDRKGQVIDDPPPGEELLRRLNSGDLELRQEPGPGNALGTIKFFFPNRYDVYLHGTPERQLFSRSRRDFSHGCIRVEDPPALAAWVLRDDPAWTAERIQKEMKAGDTPLYVKLPKPVTVLILYGTAFVDEDGEARFFDDIYGLDAVLKKALAQGYPYPP